MRERRDASERGRVSSLYDGTILAYPSNRGTYYSVGNVLLINISSQIMVLFFLPSLILHSAATRQPERGKKQRRDRESADRTKYK